MTKYQVWINDHGRLEHTTLNDDEWLTIEIEPIDVDAAIEECGWCGTVGTLSGNRVVLQDGSDNELRVDARAFLG